MMKSKPLSNIIKKTGSGNPTVSEARLHICRHCEHFGSVMKTCALCNCFMPAKVLIKSASCPANPPRWIAVNDPQNNPSCGGCPH